MADSVTINDPAGVMNYNGTPPAGLEGRIYPLAGYMAADGTVVQTSSPHGDGYPGVFYWRAAAHVTDGVVTFDPFEGVKPTLTSIDAPTQARLGLYLFSAGGAAGRTMGEVTGFGSFVLSDEAEQTWEQIRAYNLGTLPSATPRDVAISGSLDVGGNVSFGGVLTGNIGGASNIPGTPSGPAFESLEADASLWAKYQADGGGVGRFDIFRGAPGVSVFGVDPAGFVDTFALKAYTRGTLPAPGRAGRLARLSDLELLVMDDGARWSELGKSRAQGFFDINLHYGVGPDDAGADGTSAFQGAWNEATAWALANNKPAYIIASDGLYKWGGALQHSNALAGTNLYNAQVTIPRVDISDDPRITVTMRPRNYSGHALAVPWFNAPSDGLIIHSTLAGQSYDATWGHPSILGGPEIKHGTSPITDSTYMTVVLQGVGFRQGPNPSLCGADLRMVETAWVENCRFDTTDLFAPGGIPATEPTAPTGVACLMPINGVVDGAGYKGFNQAVGMFAGFGLSEIAKAEYLFALRCVVGLNLQDAIGYTTKIDKAILQANRYGIAHVNPTAGVGALTNLTLNGVVPNCALIASDVTFERAPAGGWNETLFDLFDPANALGGFLKYVSGAGPIMPGLLISGGRNLKLENVTNPFAHNDVITDHLNGQAGKALTTRAPLVNQLTGWEVPAGLNAPVFNADGGVSGTVAGDNGAVIESKISDGIISMNVFFVSNAGTVWVYFRHADTSNTWYLEYSGADGTVNLVRRQTGSNHVERTQVVAKSNSRFYSVQVNLSGTTISPVVNGTALTPFTSSFNQNLTKHGFYLNGADAAGNNFRGSPFTY